MKHVFPQGYKPQRRPRPAAAPLDEAYSAVETCELVLRMSLRGSDLAGGALKFPIEVTITESGATVKPAGADANED